MQPDSVKNFVYSHKLTPSIWIPYHAPTNLIKDLLYAASLEKPMKLYARPDLVSETFSLRASVPFFVDTDDPPVGNTLQVDFPLVDKRPPCPHHKGWMSWPCCGQGLSICHVRVWL